MKPEKSLVQHQLQLQNISLSEINLDNQRAASCQIEAANWLFDFSKHYFTQETLAIFSQWIKTCKVSEKQKKLFDGDKINFTENQPALHWLLRCPDGWSSQTSVIADAFQQVSEMRQQLRKLTEEVKKKSFTDIVSIGIGGSHLGPNLIYKAFQDPKNASLRCHFISNLDHADINSVLKNLIPNQTIFIFVSKSFSTEETLVNGKKALEWLRNAEIKNVTDHCYAVTANSEKAKTFGIHHDHILPMWPWLVGRYSVWSAVSWSLYLSLGEKSFNDFLAGAHAMDQHVRESVWPDNAPLFAAVLDVWYGCYWQWNNQAVIPYSSDLSLLPDYLQQLWMESLGKQVSEFGDLLEIPSGRILWGGVGTNSQHSFHQLLMQGTQRVPVDFIVPLSDKSGNFDQQQRLVAHAMSQSRAMMQGWSEQTIRDKAIDEKIIPHMVIPGGNPSTVMMCKQLNLATLGALLAFYEHRVFYQSVLLGINAFDQWGVEYGKQLVNEVDGVLGNHLTDHSLDPATSRLVEYYRRMKNSDF